MQANDLAFPLKMQISSIGMTISLVIVAAAFYLKVF